MVFVFRSVLWSYPDGAVYFEVVVFRAGPSQDVTMGWSKKQGRVTSTDAWRPARCLFVETWPGDVHSAMPVLRVIDLFVCFSCGLLVGTLVLRRGGLWWCGKQKAAFRGFWAISYNSRTQVLEMLEMGTSTGDHVDGRDLCAMLAMWKRSLGSMTTKLFLVHIVISRRGVDRDHGCVQKSKEDLRRDITMWK